MPDAPRVGAPQTDDDHRRPDGSSCPYVGLGGFCSKCGWTVDLLAALAQSIEEARRGTT